MGAPTGNQNAKKAKVWTDAIRKCALRADKDLPQGTTMIDKAAMALWSKAVEGEIPALKEIGDRLEGKAAQSVTLSGDEDNPLRITRIEEVIVDPKD